MNFSKALDALKEGMKIGREGWNGKDMFIVYVATSAYEIAPGICHDDKDNSIIPDLAPWIGMKTADNKFVPWLASQSDLLANDWVVVGYSYHD